jgi:transcriptional regulator with XRE-family HTH domain
MTTPPLASYLRSHRLKSGLNQRELAELVGLIGHHQVSIHERSVAFPSLMAALSYEAVFGVPVSELFPGLYEPIRMNIEEQLTEMEKKLQGSTAKGHAAQIIARKLEWLWARKNPQIIDSDK